jgi:hypothetical protein
MFVLKEARGERQLIGMEGAHGQFVEHDGGRFLGEESAWAALGQFGYKMFHPSP